MPNNCGNTVYIIGPEQDLNLFAEKQLAFSYFHPAPQNTDIEWCYENWGTKWDPYDIVIERNGPNGIEFNFTTAWSPPIPFLTHLLAQYPSCWMKLTYGEPMVMVAGIWIGYMKNGVLKEKTLNWLEPLAMLTTEGKLLIDLDDE